jgi:hypothetical protein
MYSRVRDVVNDAAELTHEYESPQDKVQRLLVVERIKHSCYHEHNVHPKKYETLLRDVDVRVATEVRNGGKVILEFFVGESCVGQVTLGFFLLAEDFWYALKFRSHEGVEVQVDRNWSLHAHLGGELMVLTKERKNRIYRAFRDDVHDPGITLHLARLWSILERCTWPRGERPAWVDIVIQVEAEVEVRRDESKL